MRVLIADDDRVLVHMLGTEFRKRGWEVLRAFDAMQAGMFASREPQPDVVILDLGMPGGSGFDVLERLGRSVKTSAIPVMVVTGSQDDESVRTAEEFGVAGYFTKPVQPAALIDEVEAVVGAPPT